jgi:transposase
LEPIKQVARSFKGHLENVLTYFTHRITNAALAGLNNRIAGLVKKAFGYRNRERFKTDILFHLGGLDLHPSQ